MKIVAKFKTNAHIYDLLKEKTEVDYEEYECNWGSSMWWDDKNPNVYTQNTVGGNTWIVSFLPENEIQVEFEGRRNSALCGNCLGWHFEYYRPGNHDPACFLVHVYDGLSSYDIRLRGEALFYETSVEYNGKPVGFEAGETIWGENKECIVLHRPEVIFDEKLGENRVPTDEEVVAAKGYRGREILLSEEKRIFIKK